MHRIANCLAAIISTQGPGEGVGDGVGVGDAVGVGVGDGEAVGDGDGAPPPLTEISRSSTSPFPREAVKVASTSPTLPLNSISTLAIPWYCFYFKRRVNKRFI
jgi:hypothetical protein